VGCCHPTSDTWHLASGIWHLASSVRHVEWSSLLITTTVIPVMALLPARGERIHRPDPSRLRRAIDEQGRRSRLGKDRGSQPVVLVDSGGHDVEAVVPEADTLPIHAAPMSACRRPP
jgi:hypothetical protein